MDSRPEISIRYKTLVHFLEAAEGNYRHSLNIRCGPCNYCREEGCGDFLFIPGPDCVPILLPLADAVSIFGSIDPSDCAGILYRFPFLHLYHSWLMQQTSSDQTCPFHQILELNNRKIGK